MAYPDKKKLLNISIILLALSLLLLMFEFSKREMTIAVFMSVGVLAFLFFMFNRVLLVAIFIALSFFDFTIEGLTYFKVLGYLLLLVLMIHFLLKQIHMDVIDRMILLLGAIFLVCAASQLINKSFVLFYLIKLVMIFAMIVSIRVFITRLEDLKFVLWILALAGMVAAGITIYEVILNPDIKRAEGSLGNPNNTAAIFCMLLPFSTVLLGRKSGWQGLMFSALVALFLMTAIFLTASRGALLTLIAVAAAALIMFRMKGKIITISLLLFSVLLFYTLFDNYQGLKRYEQLLNSGNVIETEAVQVRLEITAIGLQLFMDNPVWGVGAGSFQSETKDMETEYNGYLYSGIAPHNMYTQILAELGMVGFLLFGWFYFTIFEYIFSCVRHSAPEIRRVAKMLLFSFIAIMVSMVTSGNYVSTFIYIVAGFSLVLKNLAMNRAAGASASLYAGAPLPGKIRYQV